MASFPAVSGGTGHTGEKGSLVHVLVSSCRATGVITGCPTGQPHAALIASHGPVSSTLTVPHSRDQSDVGLERTNITVRFHIPVRVAPSCGAALPGPMLQAAWSKDEGTQRAIPATARWERHACFPTLPHVWRLLLSHVEAFSALGSWLKDSGRSLTCKSSSGSAPQPLSTRLWFPSSSLSVMLKTPCGHSLQLQLVTWQLWDRIHTSD